METPTFKVSSASRGGSDAEQAHWTSPVLGLVPP